MQHELIFENIYFEANVTNLISAITPIDNIKIVNSVLSNSKIQLTTLSTQGIVYPKTHILMVGTTFKGEGSNVIAA